MIGAKINSMVDNVYVLNLERDLFKYEILKRKLDKKGIRHERFVGVDGYSGDLSSEKREESFRDVLNAYRDSELFLSIARFGSNNLSGGKGAYRTSGAMGAVLSYLKIFENAIKNKYEKILLLQDDIYFHKQFEDLFLERESEIRRSAIFYLGATEWHQAMRLEKWASPNWSREHHKYGHYWATSRTMGMFAVMVDKKVFQPFLDLLRFKFFPDDQALALLGKEMFNGESLVSYPNLVIPDTQQSHTTDRKKGWNHENHAKNLGWDYSYYDLSERYYN